MSYTSIHNLDEPIMKTEGNSYQNIRAWPQNIVHASGLPMTVVNHYSPYKNSKANSQPRQIFNTTFDIDAKYEIIDAIGQGAYGIVVAAEDKTPNKKKTKSFVAIKKIEKAFEHKLFTKRTLRELKILRLLQHENVIGINSLLLPRSREEFKDIYVSTPLMESDLATIIKSPQPLNDEHIQFFIYQLLRGLKYVHSAGIIHRDLKPRNLLVNSNCDLKICDFGLSRTTHCHDETGRMTDYVATRWYRAPELILEVGEYGPSVDVWSVGCILAELLKRKPFLPGTDSKNQLDLIFNVFGTPSEEFIAEIPKPRLRRYLRSLPQKESRIVQALFPKSNHEAVDLLKKLMALDWRERITVDEALKHPYLKDLHCPTDEPVSSPVPSAEFEFEKHNLSLEQLKDLVYEEILLYHYDGFRKEYFRRIQSGESAFKDVINNDNIEKQDEEEDA